MRVKVTHRGLSRLRNVLPMGILEREHLKNWTNMCPDYMGSVSTEQSRFQWTYTKRRHNGISEVKGHQKKIKVSWQGDGLRRWYRWPRKEWNSGWHQNLSSAISDSRGQGNHSLKALRGNDLKTNYVPNYHSGYFQRVTNFTMYSSYLIKLLEDIL